MVVYVTYQRVHFFYLFYFRMIAYFTTPSMPKTAIQICSNSNWHVLKDKIFVFFHYSSIYLFAKNRKFHKHLTLSGREKPSNSKKSYSWERRSFPLIFYIIFLVFIFQFSCLSCSMLLPYTSALLFSGFSFLYNIYTIESKMLTIDSPEVRNFEVNLS